MSTRAARARWTSVAALVCAALTSVACSRTDGGPGDRIVVGLTSSPTNLDPRFGLDDVSQKVHQLLYDSLFVLDDQMRLQGSLAESLDVPTDRTYVVRIRAGVRFHDGHTLSAADVAHTFSSMLDPALASPRRGGLGTLTTVEALDERTVRFTLAEPFTSFPINFLLPIIPAGAGPDLRVRPNGTGPYRFVRSLADEAVDLDAFAAYWQGAPRNAGVRLKVVPDEVMRALEVRHGTMDVVVNDVSPDIYYQLRQERSIQTTTREGVDFQYVGVNLRDPILRDRRVRQAIMYGLDRDAIVEFLRRGLATTATGLLPPLSWAYASDVRTYPFDPQRARALLDEAGYPDPDGPGPASRFRLSLKVSNVEFNRLQSAVIQEQLRAIGIAVDVRTYEFATLFADVGAGNFQLFTLQWTAASLADPDILRRIFHSKQTPPIGFNRGHYRNADLDETLDRAVASRDEDNRRRLYREAQALLAEDLPYLPLWYKTNFAIARRNLSGIELNPFAELLFLRHVARHDATASN
ncbi:MAG: ABC transporter substrate-binding protein [Vicinamibacterales bacterium]